MWIWGFHISKHLLLLSCISVVIGLVVFLGLSLGLAAVRSFTCRPLLTRTLPTLTVLHLLSVANRRLGSWNCLVGFQFVVCSHAMPLAPFGTEERERARRRGGIQLQADRVIRQQTRNRRETLLSAFDSWLAESWRTNLHGLLESGHLDAEEISEALVAYGKEMYSS